MRSHTADSEKSVDLFLVPCTEAQLFGTGRASFLLVFLPVFLLSTRERSAQCTWLMLRPLHICEPASAALMRSVAVFLLRSHAGDSEYHAGECMGLFTALPLRIISDLCV